MVFTIYRGKSHIDSPCFIFFKLYYYKDLSQNVLLNYWTCYFLTAESWTLQWLNKWKNGPPHKNSPRLRAYLDWAGFWANRNEAISEKTLDVFIERHRIFEILYLFNGWLPLPAVRDSFNERWRLTQNKITQQCTPLPWRAARFSKKKKTHKTRVTYLIWISGEWKNEYGPCANNFSSGNTTCEAFT